MRYFYVIFYIILGPYVIGLGLYGFFNLEAEFRLIYILLFGLGINGISEAFIWAIFSNIRQNKELNRKLSQKSNEIGFIATFITIAVMALLPPLAGYTENLLIPVIIVCMVSQPIAFLFFAGRHYLANKRNV